MSQKPFRFGLQAFNPKSPAAWRDMLRKTEDLGYSAYHLADHILGPGPAIESTAHPPQLLAAVPAMAMALELTDRTPASPGSPAAASRRCSSTPSTRPPPAA